MFHLQQFFLPPTTLLCAKGIYYSQRKYILLVRFRFPDILSNFGRKMCSNISVFPFSFQKELFIEYNNYTVDFCENFLFPIYRPLYSVDNTCVCKSNVGNVSNMDNVNNVRNNCDDIECMKKYVKNIGNNIFQKYNMLLKSSCKINYIDEFDNLNDNNNEDEDSFDGNVRIVDDDIDNDNDNDIDYDDDDDDNILKSLQSKMGNINREDKKEHKFILHDNENYFNTWKGYKDIENIVDTKDESGLVDSDNMAAVSDVDDNCDKNTCVDGDVVNQKTNVYDGIKYTKNTLDNIFSHKLYAENYQYSYDFGTFFKKFNYSKNKNIILNVRGGFVPDVSKKYFKMEKIKNDINKCNIVDFASLYPSCMQYNNLCLSSIATSCKWPVFHKTCVYNQYYTKYFKQMCVELKLDDFVIPFNVFVMRKNLYRSVNVIHIERTKALRNTYKKEAKKYEKNKSDINYIIADNGQKIAKLLGNSKYGKLFADGSCINSALITSIVTKEGRKNLVGLFTFIKTIYYITCAGTYANMLYGDTDSIFIDYPFNSLDIVINNYNKLLRNDYIIQVELEKSIDYIIFLAKKKYVSVNKGSIYSRGIISKSQTIPGKSFFVSFINLIFASFVVYGVDDFGPKLDDLFKTYINNNDDMFYIKKKLSKNLNEYKNLNTIMYQLVHACNKYGYSFHSGSEYYYSFFNFIFTFDFLLKIEKIEKKIEKYDNISFSDYKNEKLQRAKKVKTDVEYYKQLGGEKKKLIKELEFNKMYSKKDFKINKQNLMHKNILKDRKTSSILVREVYEELRKIYGGDLCLDKEQIFRYELGNYIKNILNSISNEELTNLFESQYKNTFNNASFIEKYENVANNNNISYNNNNNLITKFFQVQHKKL